MQEEHRCCATWSHAIRAGPPSAAAEQGRGSQPGQPPAHQAVKGAARCHSSKHQKNEISIGNAGCRDARAAERVLQGMAGSPSGMVSCSMHAWLYLASRPLQGARGARMPGDSGEPASADAGWTGPQPSTSGGGCAKVGPATQRHSSTDSQGSLLLVVEARTMYFAETDVRCTWRWKGQRGCHAPKLKVTVAPSVCSGRVNSEAAG